MERVIFEFVYRLYIRYTMIGFDRKNKDKDKNKNKNENKNELKSKIPQL